MAYFPVMTTADSEVLRNIAQAIQAVVTAIAFVVAAVWTYLLFLQRRQTYARAELQHKVAFHPVDEQHRLVRVTVSVRNVGDVLIRLVSSRAVVRQVLPLLSGVAVADLGKQPFRDPHLPQIFWPLVAERACDWSSMIFEIEPNEVDEFHFDFIVAAAIETFEISSHLQSKRHRKLDISWNHHTLHSVAVAAEAPMLSAFNSV
jgi:hypothetical protein